MDDLTYGLKQLCRRNRDGSHASQADRMSGLMLMARQLHKAGFRQLRPERIKGKHVDVLLARWQAENLATGTIKNRLSHLRWWIEKVGKGGIIPADNARLGIAQREPVTNASKARDLGDSLSKVTDPYVRMSLILQRECGFRREESIKFQPRLADRGTHIVLKGSWAKGGRERVIPITTPQQRAVLAQAHRLAGAGSLIPAHKSYIEQRNVYDGQCKAAGLGRMHGLRHQYAQMRYEMLTGWKAPAAGGPSVRTLSDSQRLMDTLARQTITEELGHGRTEITKVYLGR